MNTTSATKLCSVRRAHVHLGSAALASVLVVGCSDLAPEDQFDCPDDVVDAALLSPMCRPDALDGGVDREDGGGDVPTPDAGPPGCSGPIDDDTVFLLDFEDVSRWIADDRVGSNPGIVISTNPMSTEGPDGCGNAWLATEEDHVILPPSDDFRVPVGSVDLFVRIDEFPEEFEEGIFSRDAMNRDMPGHLTLFVDPGGRLRARIQSRAAEVARCAVGIVAEEWVHVGIHFGKPGLALFIDGVEANDATDDELCIGDSVAGLDGNGNPWVIGAEMTRSDEGAARADSPFTGAVDQFRLSSIRRDFSGFRDR